MELPEVIYAKKGKDGVIYSAVKIEDAVGYIRADKLVTKLSEILVALEAKDKVIFDKMKEILDH